MKTFSFEGTISASKSILNRLLVIQSYFPEIEIKGDSVCDDVTHLRESLHALALGQELDCGEAGTTFRFLALRASRLPGTHRLKGSPRLFARPQQTLIDVLVQFGVTGKFESGVFIIQGDGWKNPGNSIQVDARISSQFASSVLLNSWNLDFDLNMDLIADTDLLPSEGYLQMTEDLLLQAGMKNRRKGKQVFIPARSRVSSAALTAETDTSSAFALAALAVVGGQALIHGWPVPSLQPDSVFPTLLSKMGVSAVVEQNTLRVEKCTSLQPLHADLGGSPDLFPVLSVLCALTEGTSVLFGAPQLAHKESSRIETSARLVENMGRKVERRHDGMVIHGRALSSLPPVGVDIAIDPQNDHRIAMAAAVAKLAGFSFRVLSPEVVDKSFPEFWDVTSRGAGLVP
ncbi:MAG: 3-phosphoshikimate 1-carboxyvinyltransferase [Bdellovibrionales bacterium]|nr:3-phosphoshikimate 1-carboxyvinyltransferase [Bdellovibrionales bacterium]